MKKSRYHSQLLMDRCDLCGQRNQRDLETHHINHQKDCVDGWVKSKPHIAKNQLYNLMVLCQLCHDKIHRDGTHINGIQMTSQGKHVSVSTR
jgi:hypothetical protein